MKSNLKSIVQIIAIILITVFMTVAVLVGVPRLREATLRADLESEVKKWRNGADVDDTHIIRILEQLRSISPGDDEYAYQMAFYYSQMGTKMAGREDIVKALRFCDLSLTAQREPSAEFFLAYADVLLKGDKWRDAEFFAGRGAYWRSLMRPVVLNVQPEIDEPYILLCERIAMTALRHRDFESASRVFQISIVSFQREGSSDWNEKAPGEKVAIFCDELEVTLGAAEESELASAFALIADDRDGQ